jgi:transposase-like protein
MNIHKNAPLTPKGREAMVRSVVEGGLSKADAAYQFNTTSKTVAKWVKRFRAEGVEGLRDRSSRPHSDCASGMGLCPSLSNIRSAHSRTADLAAPIQLASTPRWYKFSNADQQARFDQGQPLEAPHLAAGHGGGHGGGGHAMGGHAMGGHAMGGHAMGVTPAAADVTLPAGAVTVADTLTAVATAIMETPAITMDAATIPRARSLAV